MGSAQVKSYWLTFKEILFSRKLICSWNILRAQYIGIIVILVLEKKVLSVLESIFLCSYVDWGTWKNSVEGCFARSGQSWEFYLISYSIACLSLLWIIFILIMPLKEILQFNINILATRFYFTDLQCDLTIYW